MPELGDSSVQWPYSLVGICFAAYGIALIAYGSARARVVEEAVARGGFAGPADRTLAALTLAGVLLGVATLVLITVD